MTLSVEYGRTQQDLAHARPFLGPYYIYIVKKLTSVLAILCRLDND